MSYTTIIELHCNYRVPSIIKIYISLTNSQSGLTAVYRWEKMLIYHIQLRRFLLDKNVQIFREFL